MRVVAVRRDPSRGEPAGVEAWPPGKLPDLLECSDFVVISAPLTPETRGLFGDEAFARMKKTAYVINVGRGRVVDEAALIRALKERQIAGAGLDVYEKEPLPAESELYKLPNVILTPHISGTTPRYWDRVTEIFSENLRRFREGEALRNLVDKRQGY
jgi:phosphoglycerate dehydrogenase-like enzyme